MSAESDASERVEQLIGLTERLTELIGQECQAFEQRKPHEVALTLEETSKLANLYRHESLKLRNNVALVQAAPLAKRMRLMRATEAFDGCWPATAAPWRRPRPSPRAWCGQWPSRSPSLAPPVSAMAAAPRPPAPARPRR